MSKIALTCAQCGDIFFTYPSAIKKASKKNSEIKFCSRACYEESRKPRFVEVDCIICGNTIKVYDHYFKHRNRQYCSWACYKKRQPQGNPNWKGGKYKDASGYIYVFCPEHPDATKNGYVLEHRLIMEKHIGRPLKPDEVVHHVNGKKGDNRPENLALFIKVGSHTAHHALTRTNPSRITLTINPDLLRAERESKGLTQVQLSKKAKVSRATISNIERHFSNASYSVAVKLVNIIGKGILST